MSVEVARAVADTAFTERARWRSGALMPARSVVDDPARTSCVQTECVLEVRDGFTLRVTLRFRQVERRTVHRRLPETDDLRPVGSLDVDGRPVVSGDEAVEHELTYVVDDRTISGSGPRHTVRIAGGIERDAVRDATGALVGQVVRERRELCAVLGLSAYALEGLPDALRVRVWVENHTEPPPGADLDALPSAMLAVHLILAVHDAAFVSMADPPAWAVAAVEGCANVGLRPVMAGPPGRRDVLLAAPLALDDHPEPSAPGAPRPAPDPATTSVPAQRTA